LARGVENRYGPVLVRAALESMNGARFLHDTLERSGCYGFAGWCGTAVAERLLLAVEKSAEAVVLAG
jgi:hypothetical protein